MEQRLMTRLRLETRQQHRSAEARLDMNARLRSPEAYRSLLERLYGFYQPLESRLALAASEILEDWPERRKTPHLVVDLAFWGVDETDLASLDRCEDLPPLDLTEDLFGCLYVLEGATLGGQIIARLLEQRGYPRSHYGAYGAGTGEKWRVFGRRVDCADLDGDLTIRAARRTFRAFEMWLGRPT